MTMLFRGALVGGCLSLLAVACGDRSDVLGTRSAGGASGDSGHAAGGSAAGAGAGRAAGGGTGGGAMAGSGGSSGTESGSGGVGGSSAAGGSGNQAGTAALGGSGGSVSTGGAAGTSAAGGKGGAPAGGGGGQSGSATSGAAGEAAAGMSGSAGAGGSANSCPDGCTRATYAGCDGQVWECSTGFSYQEFTDGGCTDLATDVQRFCCPTSFYSACTSPCADVTTLDACEARSDCHSVFVDPGTCGCASVGCCARFSRCAEGDQAVCSDNNVSCDVMTPYCENPAYVVSYANGCYEGCVQPKDCAPSGLTDCTGLTCPSGEQSVKVRSPALGTTQCACVPQPSSGLCSDCTCGAALCSPYFATCTGFALEGGLLCTQNG